MNSLPTLIKLAQRNIDTIAVEIAEAQARIDQLRLAKETAKAKADAEQAMAGETLAINMLGSMPAYMHRLKWQQEKFDADIAEIEATIAHVRERLIAAYREKSKLENLETQYAEKAKREAITKEQALLDEVALTRRA